MVIFYYIMGTILQNTQYIQNLGKRNSFLPYGHTSNWPSSPLQSQPSQWFVHWTGNDRISRRANLSSNI